MTQNIIPSNSYEIKPIGVILNDNLDISCAQDDAQNPETRVETIRLRHQKQKKARSTLMIDPSYEPLLDGIESFSHILVLYWPHLLPESERARQKVRPMRRSDLPEQGIFATHSPARPNPILISKVRLLKREGNQLQIQGIDALNGSPVIDIKPVTSQGEKSRNFQVPDWIKQIYKDLESR